MVVLSTPGMLHGGLSLQVTSTNIEKACGSVKGSAKSFSMKCSGFFSFDAHAVLFALSLLSTL